MSDPRTPSYAEPRKPRLIWNHCDQRQVAELLPSQTVEIIRPFYASPTQSALELRSEAKPENRLIRTCDNLIALTSLLHGDDQHEPLEGKIDLIYIDPPFAVQSDFKINLEVQDGQNDAKPPALIEELAYTDTWQDGLDSYLSMMFDRLELLKRLLAPTGSIYVHCDWHACHYLRVLMDEVFGYANFQNEIAWCYREAINSSKRWNRKHDTLLFYTRDPKNFCFNPNEVLMPHADTTRAKYRLQDEKGPYRLMGRGIVGSPIQSARDVAPKWEQTHPELVYRQYLRQGTYAVDYWNIDVINQASSERVGFPTQKPIALLQRIIAASSHFGDLILDCFCGSGTTAVAAETMTDTAGKPAPRRWIAIDSGKFAIHTTRKRLIEVGARPFTVENIGCYARQGEGTDLRQKDPAIEPVPDVPSTTPEIEVFTEVGKGPNGASLTVKLIGLTVDLDDCLSAQDASKRTEIRKRLTDWRSLIDYWAVDWDYNSKSFKNDWQSFRTRKSKEIAVQASHDYPNECGDKLIAITVTDIFGNDGLKIVQVTL